MKLLWITLVVLLSPPEGLPEGKVKMELKYDTLEDCLINALELTKDPAFEINMVCYRGY